MEFRQLKTFRVVAETLNFTKAAEKLCLAQSSVSAQIKGLEQEVNTKLFDRIGKKVFLTNAGKTLLSYASRIEGMTDEIKGVLAEEQKIKGKLVIRVPETLATVYMVEIVEEYHSLYPEVELTLINCSDLRLSRELNSGRVDLAFLMTDETNIPNVTVEFLREEELVLATSESHPLTLKDRVEIHDLDGETLLFPRTD